MVWRLKTFKNAKPYAPDHTLLSVWFGRELVLWSLAAALCGHQFPVLYLCLQVHEYSWSAVLFSTCSGTILKLSLSFALLPLHNNQPNKHSLQSLHCIFSVLLCHVTKVGDEFVFAIFTFSSSIPALRSKKMSVARVYMTMWLFATCIPLVLLLAAFSFKVEVPLLLSQPSRRLISFQTKELVLPRIL